MNTRRVWIITGIIVVLNLLGEEFYHRFDLSEDNQYTLSDATKNILKGLDQPVTVKAYFSEELPPNIAKVRKNFKELLVEYNNLSHGNLVYNFENPNEDEQIEKEAIQNGVQPVLINLREKDEIKQKKAFLGAVISLGEDNEVIPFMNPGGAMEYALSTAIKKLSIKDKPTIAFMQGHGEPALSEMRQVNSALSILYSVEPLRMTDTTQIPQKVKTLVIINPSDSIPPQQLQSVDKFMNKGGHLLVAFDRVSGNLQQSYGSAHNTNIESWLKTKNVLVEDNFIIDANCAAVTVQQQQGPFRFASNISFPFIPIIQKFADHPISKGLETVVLKFPSAIHYTGDSSITYTPFAFTSDKSGVLKAPQFFDVQKQWSEADFPEKNLVVGACFEGKINGSTNAKMVIISDGDFAVNGKQGNAQRVQEDNVNMLVNSIDWLSDDTGLISLRTRGVTSRPIADLEEGTKTILKWLNFLLPVLLIIIYGFVHMQLKRNQRIKRMEVNYE